MHIAICDDNVADRKQLERLLTRESDSRKNITSVFYVDSYGLGEKLYPKRMSYDLLFIDMNESEETGLDYALRLCHDGVFSPIVLCSNDNAYKNMASQIDNLPQNLLFLSKPVIKAELTDIIDQAIIIEQNKEKTIELRHQKETYYVKEDDIVYAKVSGLYLNVKLKDGTIVAVLDNICNFAKNLQDFSQFITISGKTIVNASHVNGLSPVRVSLDDGSSFIPSPLGYKSLKTAINQIN